MADADKSKSKVAPVLLTGAGLLAAAVVAFGAGYLVRGGCAPAATAPPAPAVTPQVQAAPSSATVWTCSMHPQVRQPKPGRCPICAMALIPLTGDQQAGAGPREFATTDEGRALMEIETAPVERKFVTATVQMVGKVEYDETRLAYITAWVPGRLDRLFVDYTGVPVRKGDHLVEMYSPELLSAQEELIQALAATANLGASDSRLVREATQAMIVAAREKLRLFGLKVEQIAEVEKRGKVSDHITIYAPIGGIVVHMNALEGMYVNTGTRIYTIADLSRVWVKLDAYESDLGWLRYGQAVEFTTVAYPGETFTGTVAFIDPILDERTRTVKVRVNAPNAEGRLKPGMFIKALVRSRVAAGGRVMDAHLAGKWMCPMHPDVVKDGAGSCDICEMPLVRTESLGYVSIDPAKADKPLVIPASAALVTGKRAVVYVEVPGRDRPTYEGRQITLGPRAGDYYLVRDGLREGERVVVKGNFKIDSALQIQAKPSMMSPEGGAAPAAHHHGDRPSPARLKAVSESVRNAFAQVLAGYMAIQTALASDDLPGAAKAANEAQTVLDELRKRPPTGDGYQEWAQEAAELPNILTRAAGAKTIEDLRGAFALLSEQTIALARRFAAAGGPTVFVLHCPMAFSNRGANWLQRDREVRNPYFGSAMPRCGDVKETIPPQADGAEGGHRHE